MALIDTKNFKDVIAFAKSVNKVVVVTRGERGAIAVQNDQVIECSAEKNLKIIDLTGAGDLFAADFFMDT